MSDAHPPQASARPSASSGLISFQIKTVHPDDCQRGIDLVMHALGERTAWGEFTHPRQADGFYMSLGTVLLLSKAIGE